MYIKNIDIKQNVEKAKKLRGIDYDIDIARKSGGMITQSAISKFLKAPETSNPTVEKIRGMAKGLKLEPWMLLVPNFPFEALTNAKAVSSISLEGYRLLAAFESLPEDRKKAILDFVLFQLHQAHPPQAKLIQEARAEYAIDKTKLT